MFKNADGLIFINGYYDVLPTYSVGGKRVIVRFYERDCNFGGGFAGSVWNGFSRTSNQISNWRVTEDLQRLLGC